MYDGTPQEQTQAILEVLHTQEESMALDREQVLLGMRHLCCPQFRTARQFAFKV